MASSPAQPRSRIASIAGLIVALGAPFLLPLVPGQAQQHITDIGQDSVVVVFEWVVALAILAIVIFWERLPLSSIGFRRAKRFDFVAMAIAVVALFIASGVFSALARAGEARLNQATLAQIATLPLALRIGMFLTAGFCEELMFRGYAIERLTLLTGKLWIGGVAAVVLFTLGHLPRYGFSLSLAAVAIVATALTALYLWRRNFWICATMHALIDCGGLVIAPAIAVHGLR